jgi:hypothetical protein
MKYLPNQNPCFVRLKPTQVALIERALTDYAARVTNTNPPDARRARILRSSLPSSLPYEMGVFAQEWEILSRALRPQASKPTPGTDAAKLYALYTWLRKRCVFITEGDAARLRRAKKQRLG